MFLLLALSFSSAPGEARRVAAHAAGAGPQIRSNAVLVLDEDSSTVLLARQAEVATPIASITKLMTALVVIGAKQPLDEVLQITDEDREHGRGAFSRLAIGAQLSRGDLLHVALMSSENRAAHALGRNYPGGLPRQQHGRAVLVQHQHRAGADLRAIARRVRVRVCAPCLARWAAERQREQQEHTEGVTVAVSMHGYPGLAAWAV